MVAAVSAAPRPEALVGSVKMQAEAEAAAAVVAARGLCSGDGGRVEVGQGRVAPHHAEAAQAGRRADEAEFAARRATTAQAAKAAGRMRATDDSGLTLAAHRSQGA